jgi:capsular polysaccharide biosynthesis protein
VTNEQELRHYLSQQGFDIVELAYLEVIDQIRAVKSADVIVGPHGMGLTHLAFHGRSPKVVELFHPEIGTDAYAVLSRSLGFDYGYVIGEPVSGSDFKISVDRLADALGDAGRSKPGLS